MWPTISAPLVPRGGRVSDLPGQRLPWERPLDASLCSLWPSHVLRQNYPRFLYVRAVFFCSISSRRSAVSAPSVSSPRADVYVRWHLDTCVRADTYMDGYVSTTGHNAPAHVHKHASLVAFWIKRGCGIQGIQLNDLSKLKGFNKFTDFITSKGFIKK